MITLNNLAPSKGARKQKKRIGRGPASGSGKTASKGHKGARARSGYSASPGFEGGQMPLHRRLPKRGFTNIFKKQYSLVTLDDLDKFEPGSVVNQASLVENNLIPVNGPYKILANGTITKALTIQGAKLSENAKIQILAAGGVIED